MLDLALDVVHLWAGRVPEGMIHTDYAHRGAPWLTFALVLCTLVLGVMFRGEINFFPRAKVLRTLALAWIGGGLVLAAGTLRRIELYVEDSGLTNLRIVGFLGTVLVAVGLVLVAVKVARRQTLVWLVRRQLDALGITVVLFLVAPPPTRWCRRPRLRRHRPALRCRRRVLTPGGAAAAADGSPRRSTERSHSPAACAPRAVVASLCVRVRLALTEMQRRGLDRLRRPSHR